MFHPRFRDPLDAPDLPDATECCQMCGDDSRTLAPLPGDTADVPSASGDVYCPPCHRAGLEGWRLDSYAPHTEPPVWTQLYPA